MELKSIITIGHAKSDELIQGFVKFDFSEINVPGNGKFQAKSEYPRLRPQFEREHVEDFILEEICDQLLAWVNANIQTTGREKYFKEVVKTCVLFSVYANPQQQLHTKEMNIWLRKIVWVWLIDDVIEKAIFDKIGVDALQLVADQIQSILTGKHNDNAKTEFKDVPNYPIFRNLFHLLLDWHNICREFLPEYENRVKNFANNLKSCFTAFRWYCVDPIDGRYSEQTFKTYRRTISFVHGTMNLQALINGVNLSDDMYNSLSMNRLLEIAIGYVTFANDMLGMRKDFENGDNDNLIVFMVLEKHIPLQVAVQQVSDFIASELADYPLLRHSILQEFNHDENLIRYLDIIDSTMDGNHAIYLGSTRYRAVGSVQLTR